MFKKDIQSDKYLGNEQIVPIIEWVDRSHRLFGDNISEMIIDVCLTRLDSQSLEPLDFPE